MQNCVKYKKCVHFTHFEPKKTPTSVDVKLCIYAQYLALAFIILLVFSLSCLWCSLCLRNLTEPAPLSFHWFPSLSNRQLCCKIKNPQIQSDCDEKERKTIGIKRERGKRNVQIENECFILLASGDGDLLKLNDRSMDLRERERRFLADRSLMIAGGWGFLFFSMLVLGFNACLSLQFLTLMLQRMGLRERERGGEEENNKKL